MTLSSVFARLDFEENRLEPVELVPVFAREDGLPQVAEGKRGREILDSMDRLCRMFNARLEHGQLVRGPVREKLVFDLTAKPVVRTSARKRSTGGHFRRSKADGKRPAQ